MEIPYRKNLSTNLETAFRIAEEVAMMHECLVGEAEMVYAFMQLEESAAYRIMTQSGIGPDRYMNLYEHAIAPEQIRNLSPSTDLSPEFNHDLQLANKFAARLGGGNRYYIVSEIVLYFIMHRAEKADSGRKGSLRRYVRKYLNVDPEIIAERCKKEIMGGGEESKGESNEEQEVLKEEFSEEENYNVLPDVLAQYGTDLTARARANELDPVIGREKEIEKVVQILSRRSKNNPVLVGEPGVGKSAVVEGLAQAIVSGDVPELLLDRIVFSLDMTSVVAGTKFRGEFEERFNEIIKVVKRAGNIILFIDEIHNIVGAGGSSDGALDASNIIKPMLARGELQTVGATTLDEYRKYIASDSALERRFTPVVVDEPNVSETVSILRGLKSKYEAHHSVLIEEAAIEAAALLSDRYINDRFLPDKAIDLIDEACAKARLSAFKAPKRIIELENDIERRMAERNKYFSGESVITITDTDEILASEIAELERLKRSWGDERESKNPSIGREDIACIISEWTDIPVTKISEEESSKLLHLEEELHKRIIGQDEAIKAVSDAIRRSRAGLGDGKRPIGSFIFVGSTGVGKTDLTKALAEQLFGNEDKTIRLDMSEYMEKESVAKIIGAPPGYVGFKDSESGLLTERVRRKPYSVVLFDEIEKAHPDVFNVLLQILDDGRLTDSKGRTVSFKNCVIILTSNAGAGEIKKASSLGFSDSTEEEIGKKDYDEMKENIIEVLKRTFRPEFLNRLDDVIVFHKLTKSQAAQICEKMLVSLKERVRERGMELIVPKGVVEKLVEEGYSEIYGARPLKRAIQRELENPVSEGILAGKYEQGDRIRTSVTNGRISFLAERI